MTKASAWSNSKGMRFSSTKTEAVIFSRTKYKKPNSILLNGVPLSYSHLVKYLGVYIDSKLLWQDHVDIKLKKAKKALMAVVRVCHPTWGVTPIRAAYYWKCCIRPMFTYGCLVWHRACRYVGVQDKLKSFQRLALKIMGPIRRSTPTRGLEVINYIRPLELEIRQLAAEAYLRTMGQERISATRLHTNKITQKGHRQWCLEFLQGLNFPFLNYTFDNCVRKWCWRKRYDVDFESMSQSHEFYGKPRMDTPVHLYTDGSLLKDPSNPLEAEAGGGVVYVDAAGQHTQSNKLGRNLTVFQAEMHSLKRGAQMLLHDSPNIIGHKVAIYTDSQACLKALAKPNTKSKLVFQVMQLLNAVAAKCDSLTIRWVKAHNNHIYNENADHQAVSAAKSEGPCVPDLPLVSIQTAKSYITQAVDQLWGRLFDALTYPERCRQTKLWFPTIDKPRSFKVACTTRLQWGKLVQTMTGHNYLARHSYIVNPTDNSPICSLCDHGYIQDTEHIIAECPYFLGLRCDIFGQHLLVPPFNDLAVGKVLSYLHQSGVEALAWGSGGGH